MSDYTSERTLDWRTASPRWLLLAIIFVAVAWGSLASSFAWSLYQAREDDQERRYSDWKTGKVANHEERITVAEGRIQTLMETQTRLDADSKFARLQTQMEQVNKSVDTLTNEVRRALREN